MLDPRGLIRRRGVREKINRRKEREIILCTQSTKQEGREIQEERVIQEERERERENKHKEVNLI